MFNVLERVPKNPQHFIALCFLKAKDDPSFKGNNKLLKKVAERGNLAIFQCAYGYFCVNKKQKISKSFSQDLKVLRTLIGF